MSEILLRVNNAKLGICYICVWMVCVGVATREKREKKREELKRKRRSRRTMSLCHCVCISYEQRVHS